MTAHSGDDNEGTVQTPVSTIPSFHDGYLNAIELTNRSAKLGFRRSSGQNYELILIGLEALQVNDFREGNIVSELEVITGRDPQGPYLESRLERLFPSPHVNAEQKYHLAHAAFLAVKLANVVNGTATLVVVSASYGAELVAFCATADLRKIS